jgi:ABC-type antimicrobial peptide transport system permease subunit
MSDELVEKTRNTVIEGRFGLRGAVERGKLTQEGFDAAVANLSFTTNIEDLRDADLIIEAVPENLDIKKNVFAELDKLVKPAAVFASNTSGFAISDLNKAVSRKDKFIGMHWFSPAFVMKLVEIISAPETSEETVALIEALAGRMGKETVRVKDALEAVGGIVTNLVLAVRGASLVALLSAVLVLGGALAAGHRHRVYDAVILKTLGATRARLIAAYALEYLLLGAATAMFGVAAGSIAAGLVVTELMTLPYIWLPAPAMLAAFGALIVTVTFGLLGTFVALSHKPAVVLRNL